MKNSIRLDIVHPQKARVESFLNGAAEKLEQVAFDRQELNGMDDTIAGYKFKMKDRAAFVIVIFATSYEQANEIEAANLTIRPNLRWTVNGALFFGVESDDEEAARHMLSFFAGRE